MLTPPGYHRRIPQPRPIRTRPGLGLAVIAAVIIAAAVTVFAVLKDDGQEAVDLPSAPWRAKPVNRSAVPPPYVAAWERARNRADCALLFPLDGGPALQGAKATDGKTPNDNGWDIFLTGDAGTVEVLGLFEKTSQADSPSFTRAWADGSVAKYGADFGNAAVGAGGSNSSPFEAVLTLPDQDCAYRIYTTFGKEHLEFLFDRLRLMDA
jgi:hypothetical protein